LNRKLLIRVDAYPELGTGHLMRCIALAEGWKEAGGKAAFITCCESEKLLERIKKEGFGLHALKETGSLSKTLVILKREAPDWVVLDGYHFDTDYQKAIKDVGCRLLVVDDYAHFNRYHADIILNQNYGAENFSYNAEPHTKFLLGTKYALLRREFLKYAGFKREIPDVAKNLLITLGGADPENNTLKALRAVNLIETVLDVKVIIGASNPHNGSISKEASISGHNVDVLTAVENMAPLMAWADAAFSAGGSTAWELLYMAVPAMFSIVAENQENAVNSLEKTKFPSAGWLKDTSADKLGRTLETLLYDKDLRETLVGEGRRLVDGKGTERLIEEMRKQ
jgi:UDP-2,4-diacetamido-2,4,6-trideoxy-beta-L-altropyranose hydrolase